MTALIEKNKKRISYFRTYGRRSSCSACDRSEAQFQIRKLEKEQWKLEATLKEFDHG